MCLCGGVRSGAVWSFPSTSSRLSRSVSPDHSPITGQLGDLLALACGTPSRGWSQSQDWWSLVRKGAGAQARSLLESRYNEELPVAGSVIKLSSWADFLSLSFFLVGGKKFFFIFLTKAQRNYFRCSTPHTCCGCICRNKGGLNKTGALQQQRSTSTTSSLTERTVPLSDEEPLIKGLLSCG